MFLFDIFFIYSTSIMEPSSHCFDEPANKPEADGAFRNLSLIFVKNDKSLFCLSG